MSKFPVGKRNWKMENFSSDQGQGSRKGWKQTALLSLRFSSPGCELPENRNYVLRVLNPTHPWQCPGHCMKQEKEGREWGRTKEELLRKFAEALSSVQFSRSVVSDSLRPHESQHARPPCPSPTPGVHSNSRPSSRRWHPAILSSVVPFSSCPQSLTASESSPMSQLFTWGGQSTGVSALASVLPKKSQGWSPLEWTGWISLQSKGLSRVFSNTIVQKHQFFSSQLSSQSNSHIHKWPLEKP